MDARRIFRSANFNLLLATVICGLLLFAPLGYAHNLGEGVYAWLHGSWIRIESMDPITGEAHFETIRFFAYLPILAYSILTAVLTALFAYVTYVNDNDHKKIRWAWVACGGVLVQVILSLIIVGRLTAFVGEAEPGEIEDHIQAQFFLHAFPIVLTLLAIGSLRRNLRKNEFMKPEAGDSVSMT
ncbi:MAG: hypothetical protein AAF570_07845 [Bacteroidota bacterium]